MSFFVVTGEYMAAPKLKYGIGNSSSTTLSSSVSDSDTSFPLTSDTNFAAKSGEGMVLMDEGEATEENAYATGKTGSSLTIPLANRGLEGGSAQAHSSGASVKGIISVSMWNDLIDSLLNILDQTAGTIKSVVSFTSIVVGGKRTATVNAIGNSGATKTIDLDDGETQSITINDDTTLTLINFAAGDYLTLFMDIDGTGGHTVDVAASGVTFYGDGSEITTTASARNVVGVRFVSATEARVFIVSGLSSITALAS